MADDYLQQATAMQTNPPLTSELAITVGSTSRLPAHRRDRRRFQPAAFPTAIAGEEINTRRDSRVLVQERCGCRRVRVRVRVYVQSARTVLFTPHASATLPLAGVVCRVRGTNNEI